jgi:hypothetical protein
MTDMTIQTLKQNSTNVEPVSAGASLKKTEATGSLTTYSRMIGALFLAGFLVYGVGFGLVTSVTGTPGFLSTISAHQTTLLFGAFLMLLNTAVDVAKAVLFFPILERHGKRTALAYLATMIIEVVFLTIGVLCLLMIIPLVQQGTDVTVVKTLGSLLVQSNATAYQIGEMSLGFGALFLCSLLFRTRLIPRWLSISGLIGYACLMAGAIAEIFGLHIGLMLTIPGMFFELVLPFWLFFRGFQPDACGQES